jgi:hypothetical protein
MLIFGAPVGWDANVVVAARLMRLAVGGAPAQREAQRMVAEKVTAFAEAQVAATTFMGFASSAVRLNGRARRGRAG